jgi:dihydrofolate synthase/folylpolyglutamate synthase
VTGPLDYLFSLEKFGMKFGLGNIQTISAALNHPHTRFRNILIAGTNGKGSVTAMVDCALRAAGLKVGRYTSPHLIRLEERFAINGEPIAGEALIDAAGRVQSAIEWLLKTGMLEAPPTFFEATTAAAFLLFSDAGIDVAVLEVGLGGRLDSTNIVEPIAAAITSIDFDHEQYLGSTLAAIAAEKAGVLRGGIPVVIGAMAQEARDVIETACRTAGAEFVDAEAGATIDAYRADGRTMLSVTTPAGRYGPVGLGLRGAHQVGNAVVAVRLLERLAPAFPISATAIETGLREVRWPGRLQMIDDGRGRRVLLDAAHNPAGAWVLANYLQEEFPEPLPIVFGAMRDKDAALMLKTLVPVAGSLTMTEPSNPRARAADELATLARTFSATCPIDIAQSPRDALERAWERSPLVVVAGSIFLVGDILSSLGPSVRSL